MFFPKFQKLCSSGFCSIPLSTRGQRQYSQERGLNTSNWKESSIASQARRRVWCSHAHLRFDVRGVLVSGRLLIGLYSANGENMQLRDASAMRRTGVLL